VCKVVLAMVENLKDSLHFHLPNFVMPFFLRFSNLSKFLFGMAHNFSSFKTFFSIIEKLNI